MKKSSILFTGFVIFFLLVSYIYIDNYVGNQNTVMLKEVLSRIDGFGEIRDFDNEIGVKSIDDIGWKYDNNILYIKYGKYEFKLKDELKDKNFMQGLHNIGIDISTTDGGNYVVYYKNNKVSKLYN